MLAVLSAKQFFDHEVFELIKPLRFERGQIYCLAGPNGCGKTTLLELMAHIQRGETEMVLDGHLLGFRDHRYCSGLTYVSLHDPLPDIGVDAYLADQHFKVNHLIRNMQQKFIGKLSTGERQLLRLLPIFQYADFVLIDEPFNGLDKKFVTIIRKQLQALANNGATVIYASHILNPDDQEVACDQCIQIHSL
jgi:ABC-2 type transport system ATP-binding protein